MRLLLELYCVIVIKHVAFFTIYARLSMAFTFTSFLNLYTYVSRCGFGFELKKYWRINGFGKKDTDRRICISLLTPPPSFRDVGFCGARKTGEPGEKPSENGENQPQTYYTRTEPRPRPRPHWWEASALDLTTAPKTFLDIIYIPRSPYASSSVSMLVTDHTARFAQFD